MTAPVLDKRTRRIYAAIIGLVLIGFLEAFSYVAIGVVSPRLNTPILRTRTIFHKQSELITTWLQADTSTLFIVFDSALGWRQRAGYRSDLYTISPQGVRGTREYAEVPPAGVLRADAFGDSFVFGTEDHDSESWPAVIEREFPGIEVPNYGVGGYGLDQSVLALEAHAADLHPQVVIVGYVPDQLRRSVNVYRRFLSILEPPLVKPRFLLTPTGGLELVPPPLQDFQQYRGILEKPRAVIPFGRLDQWYSPLIYQNPLYDYSATVRLLTAFGSRFSNRYLGAERLYIGGMANPKSEAFRIQIALFDQAADSIRRMGARPVFVFFPDRETLQRTATGGHPSYQPILDTLRAHGLDPLDASEAFADAPTGDIARWFATVHYSPAGNEVVGRWLGQKLREVAPATRGLGANPAAP